MKSKALAVERDGVRRLELVRFFNLGKAKRESCTERNWGTSVDGEGTGVDSESHAREGVEGEGEKESLKNNKNVEVVSINLGRRKKEGTAYTDVKH